MFPHFLIYPQVFLLLREVRGGKSVFLTLDVLPGTKINKFHF